MTTSALPPLLAFFLTFSPVASLRADEPVAANPKASATAEPTPAKTDDSLARQLAVTKDQLATALRSYTLLQAENDRLTSAARDRDKSTQAASDQTVAAAEARAAQATAQLAAVRDELRQTQAQAAALAGENAQLRTRLALAGAPPGSMLAAPSRSAPRAPATVPPSPDVPTAAPETSTIGSVVTPAPSPHTYVVVAGDNLQKISQRVYGTPDRWNEIFEANRELIKNPNLLFVGVALRIP